MGWFDYVSDLYSSVSANGVAHAESDASEDLHNASGEFGSSKDQRNGGVGTPQHDRGAAVKGGASTSTPHSGTNEESDAEKEVNREQVKTGGEGGNEDGHVPGSKGGKEAAGQVGADNAGPHGGPVGPKKDVVHSDGGDDEDEEEEEAGGDADEEEEEEEEPEDPMPKIQAQCEKTAACAPLKHHYEECAERVTKQQEEHGKADEDCVEEFFHLMHCTTQCAAPKLFRALR